MRFATAYLSAAAWDWWEHAPVALQTGGWNDFVSALRRRFQPVTSAETARLQLRALAQGKSSVHDYVAAFRRLLVAVPSMSEDDRLFQFMQGLRPAIAAQLRIHGVKTMDAAVEMAARIGSFGELNASLSASAASSAPAAVALSGADDMQLDNIEGLDSETSAAEGSTAPVTQAQLMALINAMKHERGSNRMKDSKSGGKDVAAAIGKRFHLTPEQVREHFDKGQCFNCHSTEHSSRACPKQKKSSN